ncbi:Flagellar motor switch protein FliG [Candidatus Rhodobacter oscarellae]|uniref:Flagellar motor switch protein FliG n=1 Tax=Candidatus Rhodobacter oscarellae TaxID=1675527 RepID=A0A0J9E2D3_9RHOB|nr:Flagellar motor switch protein FliG [Candidatus Rhodobacter lobularis]
MRLLQSEGVELSLKGLPEDIQIALSQQMAGMRYIKRDTLQAVVSEFVGELDDLGLHFPRSMRGTLEAIGETISDTAAAHLRRTAGVKSEGDPWERIGAMDVEQLLPIFLEEAIEIASVALSKLDVSKSAEILGKIPGERARRIAYATSHTGSVAPKTVRKIGETLLMQFDSEPPKAFDSGPVERVGAILNFSAAKTRDGVLEGLFEEDEEFGEAVKKAIFTFANIAGRVEPRDVPKIARDADNDQLIMALAFAGKKEEESKSSEFILSNMSQRMAAQLKDEIDAMGKIKESDGEAAMGHVVSVIRDLQTVGEIQLKVEGEDDEDEE